MSSVYRFPGGIHPQEGVGGKAATAGLPIVEVPQPSRVAIPLQQHIGAPCTPTVKVGDSVAVGQVIGDSDKFVSAPIHASISVSRISPWTTASASSMPMTFSAASTF